MPLLLGINIAYRRLDRQLEAASMIGKLDVIAGHQQVIAVSFVMEAQAGDDLAARQIVLEVHQRMAVTAQHTLLVGRLEPRRTDTPEDQRPATHRSDKSEYLGGLTGKALPELRPRQEFEDLRIIIGPKPAIAGDRQCRLRDREVARTISELDRPIHVANEKFRRSEGICRYQWQNKEEGQIEGCPLLQRAGPLEQQLPTNRYRYPKPNRDRQTLYRDRDGGRARGSSRP